jgi:ATP-dependent exoDNAse (exonuclease V) alpha subunit
MIKELDRIILTRDIPENNLKKGDIGTIVMVHNNGSGFEVEFSTLDGDTLTVVSLNPEDVREIRKREIAHARVL